LSCGLLPQEPGEGSVGTATADPRARSCAAAFRLPAHPRTVATRGLAGEQEARTPAVPARGAAAAHASAPPQAYVSAPRSGADAELTARALEHGFCTRPVVRRPPVSHPDGNRSVESRESAY